MYKSAHDRLFLLTINDFRIIVFNAEIKFGIEHFTKCRATFCPSAVNPLNINTKDSSNNFHLFDQSLFTDVSLRLMNGINLSAIQFVSIDLFINIASTDYLASGQVQRSMNFPIEKIFPAAQFVLHLIR